MGLRGAKQAPRFPYVQEDGTMNHNLKAIAAATALGLALAAPSWAQTTTNNGSPGAAPRVGEGESGPVTSPSGGNKGTAGAATDTRRDRSMTRERSARDGTANRSGAVDRRDATAKNGSPGAAPRVGAGESGPVASPSTSQSGASNGMASDHNSGCDRLTGKTRDDCMARRPAADAHDSSASTGAARAPAGADSRRR
jgi:hypothetical protein